MMSGEKRLTVSSFDPIKGRFVELYDEKTFLREASFVMQLLDKGGKLAKCEKPSILAATLNVAQIGLTLNPVMKMAYLIPRWDRSDQCYKAHLDPSYQGLVKLITDTGAVTNIEANLIWEGDDIDVDLAAREKVVRHVPYKLAKNEKGELLGVYSIANLPDGTRTIELMWREDVELIRGRSETYKAAIDPESKIRTSTWITDEGEMYRKTVIRRHFKYLPKSRGWEKVAEAIALDETDYQSIKDEVLERIQSDQKAEELWLTPSQMEGYREGLKNGELTFDDMLEMYPGLAQQQRDELNAIGQIEK